MKPILACLFGLAIMGELAIAAAIVDRRASWLAWRIEAWAIRLDDMKLNPIVRADLLKARP
jgi:hypothetical protein